MGYRISLLDMYLASFKLKGVDGLLDSMVWLAAIPEADVALQLRHTELAGRCNRGLAEEEPGA